jgi:hypothetical protein
VVSDGSSAPHCAVRRQCGGAGISNNDFPHTAVGEDDADGDGHEHSDADAPKGAEADGHADGHEHTDSVRLTGPRDNRCGQMHRDIQPQWRHL